MTLTDRGQRVLEEIFRIGIDKSLALGRRRRVPTPDSEDLFGLCELLAETPREEALQSFLERSPGFVTGLLGGADNTDLAVLFKPPVGTQYRADFCVLQAHQGGAVAHLVEIESSHEPIFTKAGRTAQRLAGAMKQVEDWRIWIAGARAHFARELIRLARTVSVLDECHDGARGFRLHEADALEAIWNAFGGDEPSFTFTIIIGRWSQLSSEEKARILNRNREPAQTLRIHTYEQLARAASFRLERDEWRNESDEWGAVDEPGRRSEW